MRDDRDDNVAPMLDDLPDADRGPGDTDDPDAPDTEREADLLEREGGANEEKIDQPAELAPGDEDAAEADAKRRPAADNGGVNDPVDGDR